MKPRSIPPSSTSWLALCAMLLLTSHGVTADKDTLNITDVEFVKHEAAAGLAAVKIADLGTKKAARTDVKAFAASIAKDRSTANSELTKIATLKGVDLSAVIEAKHAETFQKLEQYSSTDFDKEFLDVAVTSQQKCVSSFEDAVKNSQDGDVRTYAENTLPTLKAHLAQAQELSSGSSTNTADGRPTALTQGADNTARNMRDRDARTLTPLDQGNSQADVDTTAQIRKEIIAGKDMSVNAQNVKIITNTGKVTLRGPVNSDAERRLIGEIAGRVAHADNVTNQLEVKSATSN